MPPGLGETGGAWDLSAGLVGRPTLCLVGKQAEPALGDFGYERLGDAFSLVPVVELR